MKELQDSLDELNNKEQYHNQMILRRKEKLLEDIIKPKELSFQELEKFALELINSYGVLSLAADRLGIGELKLRNIVAANPELQLIREQASSGIKGLVDKKMIQAIEDGDKDARDILFKMMYAGRDKGAFNIKELGSTGDDDVAFKGKDKIAQGGVHVHIHFEDDVQKRAGDFSVDDISDYIDAEEID